MYAQIVVIFAFQVKSWNIFFNVIVLVANNVGYGLKMSMVFTVIAICFAGNLHRSSCRAVLHERA